jgi:hypothetical protein
VAPIHNTTLWIDAGSINGGNCFAPTMIVDHR